MAGSRLRPRQRLLRAARRRSSHGAEREAGELAPTAVCDPSYNNSSSFGLVVLGPRGTVAWTALGAPGGIEVRKSGFSSSACQRADGQACRDRSPDLLLDHGPGVDPRSLRLAGAALSWTSAGTTRNATLD